MASKTTALTAMTTPADGDLLPVVDDPAGTPLSQKLTFSNLWTNYIKGKADAVYQALGSYITSLADDTTPQLGGDLDLNGNGIIFPSVTTTDISNDTSLTDDSATDLVTEHAVKTYVDTALGMAIAQDLFGINADRTTATETFASTDLHSLVSMNSGSSQTLTIPDDGAGGYTFPIGGIALIRQEGAGALTIAEDTSVTINAVGGDLDCPAQHATALLLKEAANTYCLWWIGASAGGGATSLNGLTDVTITSAANLDVLAHNGTIWGDVPLTAGHIQSGTLADARVAQSNITQHQAALSITESQISDLGSYITGITAEPLDDLSNVTITTPINGDVLKYNGSIWINDTVAGGGASVLDDLTDVTITSAATADFIRYSGTAWVDSPIAASDVASGTFDNARIAASNVSQHVVGSYDLYVPASAMVPQVTNGAAYGSTELATNDVMLQTLDFDQTTAEYAQFSVRMRKGWNASTVTFTPVWSHASGASFGVVWELAGLALGDSDAGDAAFGTVQSSTDTGGTNDDIFIGPTSSAITIAGSPAKGDLVMFRINRAPANGSDTLDADARLHGLTITYTTDAVTDA